MLISKFLCLSFIVGLIFITFFFLVSIFGNILLTMIQKLMKKRGISDKATNLEKLLLSFAIGISIFISFCFFLNLFGLYSIKITYYSVLILNLVFLGTNLIIYRNQFTYRKIKLKMKKFFKKSIGRDSIFTLLIFFLTLILGLFLYIDIITENVGLLSKDPYFWLMRTELTLNNESIIDFEKPWYPRGFGIINAGFLFPYSNEIFNYYFMKIVPIFYLILFYLIAFTIFKRYFNKKYLLLISFSLILISGNFLSRTLINLPSSFATILLSIFIIGIINDYQSFVTGIFIGGISLIHPLSAFFFILVLIFYLLFYLFINKNKNIQLSQFFWLAFYVIFIALILIIPYVMNFSLSTVFDILLESFEKIIGVNQFTYLSSRFKNPLLLVLSIENIDFLNLVDHPFAFYFLGSIIGSLIYLFLSKMHNLENSMLFIIVSVFIALIINFSPIFTEFLFSLDAQFLDHFKERIFENLTIPFIVTLTFLLEAIIKITKKIQLQIIIQFKAIKNFLVKSKFKEKYFNLSFFLFTLIISNIYGLYYVRANIFYVYEDNSELFNSYQYIRKNAQINSSVFLPEDLYEYHLNYLINDMRINFYRKYGNQIPNFIFYKDYDYLLIDDNSLKNLEKFPDYINSKQVYSNKNYVIYKKTNGALTFPNATYNFLNEEIGTKGLNITFIDYKDLEISTEIISKKSNHQKVLKFSSRKKFGAFINFFRNSRRNGTISFWIYPKKRDFLISIRENNTRNRILLRFFYNGKSLQYYNNGTYKFIENIIINQWVHLKIRFNQKSNWNLWIDGYKINNEGYKMEGEPDKFNWISFLGVEDTLFYLDAVKYSWSD